MYCIVKTIFIIILSVQLYYIVLGGATKVPSYKSSQEGEFHHLSQLFVMFVQIF